MSWKTVCENTDVEDNSVKLFDVEGVSILVGRVEPAPSTFGSGT